MAEVEAVLLEEEGVERGVSMMVDWMNMVDCDFV